MERIYEFYDTLKGAAATIAMCTRKDMTNMFDDSLREHILHNLQEYKSYFDQHSKHLSRGGSIDSEHFNNILRIILVNVDREARIATIRDLQRRLENRAYIGMRDFMIDEGVKRLKEIVGDDDLMYSFCGGVFNAMHWAEIDLSQIANDFGISLNDIIEINDENEIDESDENEIDESIVPITDENEEIPSEGIRFKRDSIVFLFFKLQEKGLINKTISGSRLGRYIHALTGYSAKKTSRKPAILTEPVKEELRDLLNKINDSIK